MTVMGWVEIVLEGSGLLVNVMGWVEIVLEGAGLELTVAVETGTSVILEVISESGTGI